LDAGTDGSTAPFTVDTVTPTVAVSIDKTDVNVANPTGLVTFVFSEAPVAFTLADTSAVGGTLSNLQQVNATTYTATFTGAANTDIGSPVAGFRPIRAATALPAGNQLSTSCSPSDWPSKAPPGVRTVHCLDLPTSRPHARPRSSRSSSKLQGSSAVLYTPEPACPPRSLDSRALSTRQGLDHASLLSCSGSSRIDLRVG
jgi:hypothetical protein